uniref:Uncharacterized protein n=1 Tax=Timema monikensis TaxID=170555 RepID=A0A7R9DY78_9NEOP|nr:unnamed protein product [Timema monikensis]
MVRSSPLITLEIELGLNPAGEAFREVLDYPFRAGASKAVLVVLGQSCELSQLSGVTCILTPWLPMVRQRNNRPDVGCYLKRSHDHVEDTRTRYKLDTPHCIQTRHSSLYPDLTLLTVSRLNTPHCIQTRHSSLLDTPHCIQTRHSSLYSTLHLVCPSQLQNFRLLLAQKITRDLGTSVHVIGPVDDLKLTGKDNKLVKQIVDFRLIGASCPAKVQLISTSSALPEMFDTGEPIKSRNKPSQISAHALKDYHSSVADVTAGDVLFVCVFVPGFDGNNVFVLADAKKKGGEGNSELRKVLTHKPDPCLQYPQNTYGTTFVSQNFLEARASGRKQFLQVVSHRLADALSTELYEDCICFLRDGAHAETRCRVSGRKERERLEVSNARIGQGLVMCCRDTHCLGYPGVEGATVKGQKGVKG